MITCDVCIGVGVGWGWVGLMGMELGKCRGRKRMIRETGEDMMGMEGGRARDESRMGKDGKVGSWMESSESLGYVKPR